MIKKMVVIVVLFVVSMLLTGCMDKSAINADFRRMDQIWGAENEQNVSELEHKIKSTSRKDAVRLVEKTFVDLGMTVMNSSIQDGYVLSKNKAPIPLSDKEWKTVREIENPKLAEYVGWMVSIERDPSAHFVIVKATITDLNTTVCEITLDALMEMPVYVNMGLLPFKELPPYALKIASKKIWSQLDRNVAESN